MKNFRLYGHKLDVRPLLWELASCEDLWSFDTEWTRKANAIRYPRNIVCRYVTLGLDPDCKLHLFEDRCGRDEWNKPALAKLTSVRSLVLDCMRAVSAEHLGSVVITRMAPGEVIEPHVDVERDVPGLPYWKRYQLPLLSKNVRFVNDDETYYPEPGVIFGFDGQKTHAVHNAGDEDRISMWMNLRPWRVT